jgi:hypothetical protein
MSAADHQQRRVVANPILALPAIAALQQLPVEHRALVSALLIQLGLDAKNRADKSWRQNKAPMAAYWKAVGVYARHIARAIRNGGA